MIGYVSKQIIIYTIEKLDMQSTKSLSESFFFCFTKLQATLLKYFVLQVIGRKNLHVGRVCRPYMIPD
jgi:hypothetical protein